MPKQLPEFLMRQQQKLQHYTGLKLQQLYFMPDKELPVKF